MIFNQFWWEKNQISERFAIVYDYCIGSNYLVGAFVTSDGKIGAIGIQAPQGFIYSNSKFGKFGFAN